MVNLTRRLALDHAWVYKPEDVISLFQKFKQIGHMDLNICPSYPLVNSTFLIDDWRSKGCEDILAVTYMCANHAIPILHFFYKVKPNLKEYQENLRIFILEPFIALDNYFEKPEKLYEALKQVRSKISHDYFSNPEMEFLEDQLIHCLYEFGQVDNVY